MPIRFRVVESVISSRSKRAAPKILANYFEEFFMRSWHLNSSNIGIASRFCIHSTLFFILMFLVSFPQGCKTNELEPSEKTLKNDLSEDTPVSSVGESQNVTSISDLSTYDAELSAKEHKWRSWIRKEPKKPHSGIGDEDWQVRINREVALGKRDPWREEQVIRLMKMHKHSLKDLGYAPTKSGIGKGRVLVCGHILEPPFELRCAPCNAKKYGLEWVGQRLLVNGVALASSCQDDECGKKIQTSLKDGLPPMKLTECEMRYDNKIKEIEDRMAELNAEVDTNVVEKLMAVAAAELEELDCPEGTPPVEFLEITRPQKGMPKCDYTIVTKYRGAKSLREIPYPDDKSEIEPITAEERRLESLDQCQNMQLKSVSAWLESGYLVYRIGGSPYYMDGKTEQRMMKILRSNLDVLTKWKKLSLFGYCPDCLMINHGESSPE